MTERTIGDKQFFSYVDASKGTTPAYAMRITYDDSAQTDAFGRVRTSVPTVVFDSAESVTQRTDRFTTFASGAGITYLTNYAAHRFTMGSTSGNVAIRQGKRINVYVPGTSILILNTGIMGAGAVGQSQRIGYYNDQNGVFFEQRSQIMGVVKRSFVSGSVVDTRVDQEDWNIDPMDGSGPSGIDLDFTKAQIFMTDIEWLGVGRVRMGFVYEGRIIVCHEFKHGNELDSVYMSTANLPVRFECVNFASSSATTDFRQICSSVIIEGEKAVSADRRSVSNDVTPINVTSVVTPILSLRLQTAYVGSTRLQPLKVSTISLDAKDLLFQVVYNGTLTGDSFSNNSGIAAFDVSATSITGGIVIDSWYSKGDQDQALHGFQEQDSLSGSYAGVPDTITVIAKSVTGITSGRALAAIDYEEFL